MYNSTTSNLRKHLISTRPEIHADAVQQLSEMEKDSPTVSRNAKRKRLELAPQSPTLITIGAVNVKTKFKHDHPRQIEW